MIYVPGEWSEKEIRSLFSFAPEDTESEDPDVLYSGEMIDVKNGGIKLRLGEQAQPYETAAQQEKKFAEIGLEPYSIQGNLFEIKALNSSASRKNTGKRGQTD